MRRGFVRPAALLLLLCATRAPRVGAEELPADQWYAILLGSVRVGTLHQRTTVEADGALRTETHQQMAVRRYGEPFTVTQRDTWLEDERGLRFLQVRLNSNGQIQDLEGQRTPDGLAVRLLREGQESRVTVAAPEPLLGPALAGRAVASLLAAGTREPLGYVTFSAQSLALVRVEVRPLGDGELRDSLGVSHRGRLAEERSSELPGVATRQVYGGAGQLLYAHTPLGAAIELLALSAAEEGPTAAAPLFEIATLGIPVSGLQRLSGPPGLLAGVTLRFTGRALDLLADCLTAFTAGGAVAVRSSEGGTLEVQLARPAGGRPGGPIPEAARQYLGDGFYLNLEDPRLAPLAEPCRAERETGGGWLACLEQRVNRHLERKSLDWGFAGVAEILSSRAGDCSEHALLLAALLRREGVPARLAYGFLFTEAGFVGHAWTEAWVDGDWRWLDPSFPGGEPYALKLPLGTIDPAEPLGVQMGLTLLRLAGGVQAALIEAVYNPGAGGGR